MVPAIHNPAAGKLEILVKRISREFDRRDRAWSRVIAPSFRDLMKPVRSDVRRRTPVRTGALKGSIRTAVDRRYRTLYMGYDHQKRGVRYQQMAAIEYGREGQRAQSPLRESWRASGIDEGKVADAVRVRLDRFLAGIKAPSPLKVTTGGR